MFRLLTIAFVIGSAVSAIAQTPAAAPRPARPTPPTRDPHTPGYVTAKELPDGTNAPRQRPTEISSSAPRMIPRRK